MSKSLFSALGAGALTAVMAPAAMATTLLDGTDPFSVSATTAGQSQTLNFTAFNPALGTLTGVEIDIVDAMASASGTLTNGSGASHTYTISQVATLTAVGDGFNATADFNAGTLNVGSVAAHAVADITSGTASGTGTQTLNSGLAPFTSPIALMVTGANQFVSTPGSSTIVISPDVTGTVSLYFDYTPAVVIPPAPEPQSWALMILGIGIVGGALRWRRRLAAA